MAVARRTRGIVLLVLERMDGWMDGKHPCTEFRMGNSLGRIENSNVATNRDGEGWIRDVSKAINLEWELGRGVFIRYCS